MKASIKLSNAVTDVGNLLTAAEWPVKAVKFESGVKFYDAKKIYKDLVFAQMDMENELADLRDCVNELCLKCGNYSEAHNGACDGCRWKEVKDKWKD